MSNTDPKPPRDPYKILGLAKDAKEAAIKRAYRKQVGIHHPDKHQAADAKATHQEIFLEVQWAYDLLMDQDRRAHWDQHGLDKAAPPPPITPEQRLVMTLLADAFHRVDRPGDQNPVKIAEALCSAQIARYYADAANSRAEAKKIRDVAGRLTPPGGHSPIIEDMMLSAIDADNMALDADKNADLHVLAKAELAKWSYRLDASPAGFFPVMSSARPPMGSGFTINFTG